MKPRQPSIMIIDDDISALKTLSAILKKKGFETDTATTGKEALEKTAGRFYNIALMDIKLPDREGLDLVQPIMKKHPDMKIFFITGYATVETAAKAINHGAAAYITKPVNIDDLLERIGNALEKQRLVIENRELYETVKKELAERKLAEKQLRRERNLLDKIMHANPVGIIMTDKDGTVIFSNDQAARVLRIPKDRLVGLNCSTADMKIVDFKGEPIPNDERVFCRVMISKESVFDVLHVFIREGSKVYISFNAEPLFTPDGVFDGAVMTVEDITPRVLMEEQLKSSEEKYRFLYDYAPIGYHELDEKGKIIRVNQTEADMLGYKIEEMLGQPVFDFIAPEEREAAKKRMKSRTAGKKVKTGRERRILRKDGSVAELQMEQRELRDEYGTFTGILTTSIDITERKQREKEYRELFDGMNDTAFVIGFDGRFLAVNETACRVLGYSRKELFSLGPVDIDPHLKPEAIKQLIEGMKTDKKQVFGTMHRTKKGENIPVEISSSPVTYMGVSAVLSVARDITERKQAEEAIEETQRRLATLISNLPGVVYRCRNEKGWPMEFISDGILPLAGYPASDFLEHRREYSQVVHPDERDRIWDEIQDALKKKQSYALYYRIVTASGEEKWVWEQGCGIYDADGTLLQLEGFITDITERKQAEDALERSETTMRAIFESTRDGILVADAETRKFIIANGAICRMLDYSRDEILKLGVGDIHPKKDLSYVQEQFERQFRGEISLAADLPVKRKDGSVFHADIDSASVEIGGRLSLFGLFRDITERKLAEEQLKEYYENLEHMVEERTKELNRSLHDTEEVRDRLDVMLKAVREGIIVTDIGQRIVMMNHAAEDLLGVRLSDVINRSVDYAINDRDFLSYIRRTVQQDISTRFGFTRDGANGGTVYLQANTTVIHDKNGEKTGIVVSFHDITEEREIDRMKTEFISTAAHELRSPLTSILGFSELLKERKNITKADQKKMVTYIHKQSTNLAKIVSNLLDIARIESGRGMELNKEITDIGTIIDEVVSGYRESGTKHEFVVSLPEEEREFVIDPEKFEQIMNNIINNAVKYSPDGGKVTITGKADQRFFHLTVSDEGIGMTPLEVERIFDKFYRADASDSAVEGTGLGMSIVKYLVEGLGGEIVVESEKGKGTSVTVSLLK